MPKTRHLNSRARRAIRVRKKVRGTAGCPRLSVFRSNRHVFAQIIDDETGWTVASASDLEIGVKGKEKPGSQRDRAEWIGGRIAEKAREKKIREVQFDRGRYKYHGAVAALAAGARKGGLKF